MSRGINQDNIKEVKMNLYQLMWLSEVFQSFKQGGVK